MGLLDPLLDALFPQQRDAAREAQKQKELIESTATYNIGQAQKSAASVLEAAGLKVDASGNLVLDTSNPLFRESAGGQIQEQAKQVSGSISAGLAASGVEVTGGGTAGALQAQVATEEQGDIASMTTKAKNQYDYYIDAAKQIRKDADIAKEITDLKLEQYNLQYDQATQQRMFDMNTALFRFAMGDPTSLAAFGKGSAGKNTDLFPWTFYGDMAAGRKNPYGL